MFVDKALISLKAGNGGHGAMSFRREKFEPNGGPDGGNGGHGGDIYLQADKDLRTLLPFKYQRHYQAENGGNGAAKKSSGKKGKDLTIKVPVGTVAINKEDNHIICDLTEDGETFKIAAGGKGGLGNMNFSNSVRQSPRFAQGGFKGEEKEVELELKLLADVGLIGYPNVGKSTFLSRVTKAKPKIGNYHFTTLQPNLGVLDWKDFDSFVLADIPGIIDGAHEGTGLGLEFLRHIERTKLLIHFIDVSGSEGRDPVQDFKIINQELLKYNKKLGSRKQIIALNKSDSVYDKEELELVKEELEALGYETYIISAVTGEGIDQLLTRSLQLLEEIGEVEPIFDINYEDEVVYTLPDNKTEFSVEVLESREGRVFNVLGDFDQLIHSVNFDDLDSVGYFQKKLKKIGLFKKLEEMGIEEEDLVRIQNIEFEYFK